MKHVIILFGLLMLAAATFMAIRPAVFIDTLKGYSGSASLHMLAVVVRLVLGVALVFYAGQSRFPLTLLLLGGISIAAATVIAAIPSVQFKRLIASAIERFADYVRASAAAVFLFAFFLLYAVF